MNDKQKPNKKVTVEYEGLTNGIIDANESKFCVRYDHRTKNMDGEEYSLDGFVSGNVDSDGKLVCVDEAHNALIFDSLEDANNHKEHLQKQAVTSIFVTDDDDCTRELLGSDKITFDVVKTYHYDNDIMDAIDMYARELNERFDKIYNK